MIFAFVEPFRIYFGFAGNLCEEVSSLATLVLLSIFPQSLCIGYLAYYQPIIFPADPLLGSFMLIFLVSLLYNRFISSRPSVHFAVLLSAGRSYNWRHCGEKSDTLSNNAIIAAAANKL